MKQKKDHNIYSNSGYKIFPNALSLFQPFNCHNFDIRYVLPKYKVLDIFYVAIVTKNQHNKPLILQYLFKIDNNVDRNLLLVNVEDPLRKGT